MLIQDVVRKSVPSTELAHNAVHNRNVLLLHIVHHYLAHLRLLEVVAVPEEQEVAALEGGFHRAGEDNDDRGGGVADDAEAFPHLREVSD